MTCWSFPSQFWWLAKVEVLLWLSCKSIHGSCVHDGWPIFKTLVAESFAVEIELTELQEDLCLKLIPKFKFWKKKKSCKNRMYWTKFVPHLNFPHIILLWIILIKFVKSKKYCVICTNQHLMANSFSLGNTLAEFTAKRDTHKNSTCCK